MIPPTINRIGQSKSATDDLRVMVEQIRESMTSLSDYLNTIAAAVHPDIIELMIAHGLDIPGRFSFSHTSGQKVADEVHKQLKRAADQALATAKITDAVFLLWLKQVKQPVEAAIAAREKSSPIKV